MALFLIPSKRRISMDYEGKFRDFMVGWLARQLAEPGVNSQEVEMLYEAVVGTENDGKALIEVEKALGNKIAQALWDQGSQWHDPTVEKAWQMIGELRERSIKDFGDATKFYLFFLNPFKEGCVPAGFEVT